MMKELSDGIKARLRERISNPLLATFTLSWAIVNYEVFVILLSELPASDKIASINEGVFGGWHFWIYGIGVPLSWALVYLYILPKPMRAVYRFHAQRQQELREDRLKIERQTPLTQDESNAILAENSRLREQIETERKEFRARFLQLEQAGDGRKQSPVTTEKRPRQTRGSRKEATPTTLDADPRLSKKILEEAFNGAKVAREEYVRTFNEDSRLEVEHTIDQLLDGGYLDYHITHNGQELFITADGRKELLRLRSFTEL